MVAKMLTVHQMLLNNRFLTGIGSGNDEILSQTRPKPNSLHNFTGDCLCFDCNGENRQQKTVTATGTEFFNFSSTKPMVGLVLCARGFDSIRLDNEIKTTNSNKFLQLFKS